jgi:hypothetical protein
MGRFRIQYTPAPTPGAKRKTDIERVDSAGDKTLTASDLKRDAISRYVVGRRRDTISFNNVDGLARDLGMSVGDSFDFKVFVETSGDRNDSYAMLLPDPRNVSGLTYYGNLAGLASISGPCIHSFEFFYVASGKMAVAVSTTLLART